MALNRLNRGARVVFEIPSKEVFEGTITRIASESIDLQDVFCQTNSSHYEGTMTFFRNELVKISTLEKPNPQSSVMVNASSPLDSANKIKMDRDEFNRLKQMTFNFIFINTFGKSFNDAIEVLNNRESVAVVSLGIVARSRPLSLLLLADFKQIFIFDLYCLVEFKALKDILESSFICKIVHGGAALNDCLYHKYGIQMQNIFDTQIVDSMLSQENDSVSVQRNISECLTHHFNFPPSLLSAAVEDMKNTIWQDRPLTKSSKIKAAQLVVYLPTLKDILMSEIFKKYSKETHCHYIKFINRKETPSFKFKS